MPRKNTLGEPSYLEELGEKPSVIRFFKRRTDGAIIYDVLYANRQVVTGQIAKRKFEKWLNH